MSHAKFSPALIPGIALSALLAAAPAAFAQDAAETPGQKSARAAAAQLATAPEEYEDESVILDTKVKSNPHRVYVTDAANIGVLNQIYVVDGDSAEVLGMVPSGWIPHPLIANDGSFVGSVSSYWSRAVRGTRTDTVEIFDPTSLEPIKEIALPGQGRFLSVFATPWLHSLSPDKKRVFYSQFSPSPAVYSVDMEAGKVSDPIDIPDCYHIFPTSSENFYMHCREGTLLHVKLGEKPSQSQTKPFHGEDDYVINSPYYSSVSGKLVWPTYTGRIFQAQLTGDDATFQDPIEGFTDAEKAEGWKLGGTQMVAYHRGTDRVFLLADKKPDWSHKTPSGHVFVIDGKTGKRLAQYDLGHKVNSITVSQDAEPKLFAVSAGDATLYIFDALTGKQTGETAKLGTGPLALTVVDQE